MRFVVSGVTYSMVPVMLIQSVPGEFHKLYLAQPVTWAYQAQKTASQFVLGASENNYAAFYATQVALPLSCFSIALIILLSLRYYHGHFETITYHWMNDKPSETSKMLKMVYEMDEKMRNCSPPSWTKSMASSI